MKKLFFREEKMYLSKGLDKGKQMVYYIDKEVWKCRNTWIS